MVYFDSSSKPSRIRSASLRSADSSGLSCLGLMMSISVLAEMASGLPLAS